MEFFLNKEKDQVVKTKEKFCQKQLFRNLRVGCHQAYVQIEVSEYKNDVFDWVKSSQISL